jgi:hypothetical protein
MKPRFKFIPSDVAYITRVNARLKDSADFMQSLQEWFTRNKIPARNGFYYINMNHFFHYINMSKFKCLPQDEIGPNGCIELGIFDKTLTYMRHHDVKAGKLLCV